MYGRLVAGVVLVQYVGGAAAAMDRVGDEVMVNQVEDGPQLRPVVAGASTGSTDWMAVWRDDKANGVWGRLGAADGVDQFQVNDERDTHGHKACGLKRGGYVIVWAEGRGAAAAIKAAVYSVAGISGAPFNIDTGNSPSIACLETGGFAVAYEKKVNGPVVNVATKTYAKESTTAKVQLTNKRPGVIMAPSIATLGKGFVVTWTAKLGRRYSVRARVHDGSGKASGSGDLSISTDARESTKSSVSGLRNGDFVVGWDTDKQKVAYRIMKSDGKPVSDVTYAADSEGQFTVSVAGLPSGFVMVWSAPDADGSGIYALYNDFSGTLAAAPIAVNTHTDGHQLFPTVSAIGSKGAFLIGWDQGDSDAGSVQVQVFKAPGPDGTEATPGSGPTVTTNSAVTPTTASVATVTGEPAEKEKQKTSDEDGGPNLIAIIFPVVGAVVLLGVGAGVVWYVKFRVDPNGYGQADDEVELGPAAEGLDFEDLDLDIDLQSKRSAESVMSLNTKYTIQDV